MTDELRRSIQQTAKVPRQFGAREVHTFGSAAEGALRPASDIDIAVSGIPTRLFFRAMSEVGDNLSRPLDLIDLDGDTPFARYLREKGGLTLVEHAPRSGRAGTRSVAPPGGGVRCFPRPARGRRTTPSYPNIRCPEGRGCGVWGPSELRPWVGFPAFAPVDQTGTGRPIPNISCLYCSMTAEGSSTGPIPSN